MNTTDPGYAHGPSRTGIADVDLGLAATAIDPEGIVQAAQALGLQQEVSVEVPAECGDPTPPAQTVAHRWVEDDPEAASAARAAVVSTFDTGWLPWPASQAARGEVFESEEVGTTLAVTLAGASVAQESGIVMGRIPLEADVDAPAGTVLWFLEIEPGVLFNLGMYGLVELVRDVPAEFDAAGPQPLEELVLPQLDVSVIRYLPEVVDANAHLLSEGWQRIRLAIDAEGLRAASWTHLVGTPVAAPEGGGAAEDGSGLEPGEETGAARLGPDPKVVGFAPGGVRAATRTAFWLTVAEPADAEELTRRRRTRTPPTPGAIVITTPWTCRRADEEEGRPAEECITAILSTSLG